MKSAVKPPFTPLQITLTASCECSGLPSASRRCGNRRCACRRRTPCRAAGRRPRRTSDRRHDARRRPARPRAHHDLRLGLQGAQAERVHVLDPDLLALDLLEGDRALQTETQVMVKREDEQAFAELNGAYLKFVEDAAPAASTRSSTPTSASPISASPARTWSRCTRTTPSA